MCGIAGFCNMPQNWRENIIRMNDRMYHRGPDGGGIWANSDSTVVLGHRRLAIVDLTPSGIQPMQSVSGRYVIVLNGEIYNYKDIADKLKKEGKIKEFRGTSDTEVILESIEAYGFEEAIKMAKGMFAIAVYDQKMKKLLLARDRIGEKPLYYGFLRDKFIFASDIAAIRENGAFEENLDLEALALYFSHGYIPAPYTIYKNIKKLEPGSILELSAPYKEETVYKYWDIMKIAKQGQENIFKGTEKEAADELERLLKNSIRSQMVADVPVGAFLSGGIDSTAVVAVMQALNSRKIKTFTIGFENDLYNEAPYAKKTAEYLGTDHAELYISDREAQNIISKLAGIYGEPFADSSQIPTYLVSKLARQSVTVSLSGDGGDELFCGYNIYNKLETTWNKIALLPYPIRVLINKSIKSQWIGTNSKLARIKQFCLAKDGEQLYEVIASSRGIYDKIVDGTALPDYKLTQYSSGYLSNLKNNIMLMDLQMYHPDDILVKVDRAGMAVSLESRVPFLDKDLVEFAWTLPLDYKNYNNIGKRVLKEVLYRYIPKEMMDRPKKGFSIPIDEWIKNGELRDWAEELFSESRIHQQGILNTYQVKKIWNEFIKQGKWCNQIWYILMFEEWYDKCRRV